jgi:hypothetical protein
LGSRLMANRASSLNESVAFMSTLVSPPSFLGHFLRGTHRIQR